MFSHAMRALIAVPAVAFPGVIALAAGCGAAPPEPVAAVTFGLNRTTVPFGESIDVTFQFDVAPTHEPLNEDYRVFLHALDDNESFLWADDHEPPVPTSTWRPRQSIQYTRLVRVPASPYSGPAVIAAGLYSPLSGERLPLTGDDLGESAYRIANVVIEPPYERRILVYESGWHRIESDPSAHTVWRWTTGRAVLSLRNPHRRVRLRLDIQGSSRPVDHPQQLSLVVGDRTIHGTTLSTGRNVLLDFDLSTVDLESEDVVRLELLIDPTVVATKKGGGRMDTRELGIRVFDAYVELLPE